MLLFDKMVSWEMAERPRRTQKGSGEMKTQLGIWLACGLAVLCACSAPAPEESSALHQDSSLTLSGAAAPTQRETAGASAAHYIFLEGTLVGAWENEMWHSAENGESQILAQPLEETPYYTYSPEQYLGAVEEVTLVTAENGEGETLSLPVTAEEPGDWKAYTACFGAENCALAVSDSADCLPSVVQWKGGDAVSQEDLVAVQLTAAQEGLEQDMEVQTAVVDFDGDGKQETYIFASTVPPETGEQVERAALVLLREEDSRVETVYARLLSPEEQTSVFSMAPVGIYDLNGDREEEICLRVQEGDQVSYLVVSRTGERWGIVLHSNMEALQP